MSIILKNNLQEECIHIVLRKHYMKWIWMSSMTTLNRCRKILGEFIFSLSRLSFMKDKSFLMPSSRKTIILFLKVISSNTTNLKLKKLIQNSVSFDMVNWDSPTRKSASMLSINWLLYSIMQ